MSIYERRIWISQIKGKSGKCPSYFRLTSWKRGRRGERKRRTKSQVGQKKGIEKGMKPLISHDFLTLEGKREEGGRSIQWE